MAKIEARAQEQMHLIDALIGRANSSLNEEQEMSAVKSVYERVRRGRALQQQRYDSEMPSASDLAIDKEIGVVSEKAVDSVRAYFAPKAESSAK